MNHARSHTPPSSPPRLQADGADSAADPLAAPKKRGWTLDGDGDSDDEADGSGGGGGGGIRGAPGARASGAASASGVSAPVEAEDEVDPLDAFMARSVLPEVGRLKAESAEVRLQSACGVACAREKHSTGCPRGLL